MSGKEKKQSKSFEDSLLELLEASKDEPITIRKIFEILSKKGNVLVILFLALPFCQPIPLPGVALVFGILIALTSLSMISGWRIWMPRMLAEKTISPARLQKIVDKSLKLLNRVRSWFHPRWSFICKNYGFYIFNSLCILSLGLIIAIPIPLPLLNLPTAWGILFMCLALLEDDGLFMSIGYLLTILSFVFLFLIFFAFKKIASTWSFS
jgi:hypothetical protein